MKKAILPFLALLLTSCASFQSANQVADYNGDGYVSDAEYKQNMKQRSVESANVEVETMKRRNAVNTVGDLNETIWTGRNILSGIRSF